MKSTISWWDRNLMINDVKTPFPDGWSYISNVGNNESRGEVFTPRWVVDKMIADDSILPSRMVFDAQYRASYKNL